jgi:hypothetical protein
VEEKHAELSNVNRYALLRASDDGRRKVEQLEDVATADIEINGVASLFTKDIRATLLPLAARVVVGVDDVQARWWVQEENPAWLAVGATGNHLAQLTTHVSGSPARRASTPFRCVRRRSRLSPSSPSGRGSFRRARLCWGLPCRATSSSTVRDGRPVGGGIVRAGAEPCVPDRLLCISKREGALKFVRSELEEGRDAAATPRRGTRVATERLTGSA